MSDVEWTPFEPATPIARDPEKLAKVLDQPIEKVRAILAEQMKRRFYKNSIYTVIVTPVEKEPGHESLPDVLWLSIRRNDRAPIRDWRHLQRIKNELVGAECEGVELYPAESRLVDTVNQYHLFVFESPVMRFPFGFDDRYVRDHDAVVEAAANTKQRPL